MYYVLLGCEIWDDYHEEETIDLSSQIISVAPDSPPPDLHQTVTNSSIEKYSESLARWLVGFFLLLKARFHLSDTLLDLILRFLKAYFTVLGSLCSSLILVILDLNFHLLYMLLRKSTPLSETNRCNYMLYVNCVELC